MYLFEQAPCFQKGHRIFVPLYNDNNDHGHEHKRPRFIARRTAHHEKPPMSGEGYLAVFVAKIC